MVWWTSTKRRAPRDRRAFASAMGIRSRWVVMSVGLGSLALGCVLLLARAPSSRVPNLLDDLVTNNEARQLSAKAQLRQIGTNSLPQLVAMLKSRDSPLRLRIAAILNTLFPHTLKIHSEEERRNLACKGFQALGASAAPAVPELANLLTNPPTAADAAFCLAVIGQGGVPVLWDGLTNREPVVRSRAALALGVVVPKAVIAIPRLLEALGDKERVVRSCAADSLGMIHSEPDIVIPALVVRLSDPEPIVRRAAVHAIEKFGVEASTAIPAIRGLFEDPDPVVRISAQTAVERIRGRVGP